MPDAQTRSPFFVWTGLVLLTALMFVWPIQNTIALRYWLLGFALIWSLSGWAAYGRRREAGRLPAMVWWTLGLLTVWMYIGAFGWALNPAKTLHQIASQWWVTLLSFGIGISAAYLLPDHRRLLLRLLFAVLAVNVWALVGLDVFYWTQHGHLMRRYGGLESIALFVNNSAPDKANYLTNMYFAFLLAELVLRRAGKTGLLGLGYAAIAVLFAMGFVASWIEDMRNGTAAFGLMVLLTVALLIAVAPPQRRRREAVVALLLLGFGGAFMGYMISHQPRWRSFVETFPIALDTQHNREWLTGGLPKFPDGVTVDQSNYQRIAWAKEAVHVLLVFPLGVGFQNQAFGYGVDAIYHTDLARGNHSHSGLLDLADGTGFPGLILWLCFVVGLWFWSLGAFRQQRVAPAAPLLLLVFDFTARSAVDSILADHMWQQFMFLAGFLAAWTAVERRRAVGHD